MSTITVGTENTTSHAVLDLRGTGLNASNVHIVLAGGHLDSLTERTVRDRQAFFFTDGAELAAYIARALERAQRLHARIGVADTLQEAILSRLPVIEQYQLAARRLRRIPRQRIR